MPRARKTKGRQTSNSADGGQLDLRLQLVALQVVQLQQKADALTPNKNQERLEKRQAELKDSFESNGATSIEKVSKKSFIQRRGQNRKRDQVQRINTKKARRKMKSRNQTQTKNVNSGRSQADELRDSNRNTQTNSNAKHKPHLQHMLDVLHVDGHQLVTIGVDHEVQHVVALRYHIAPVRRLCNEEEEHELWTTLQNVYPRKTVWKSSEIPTDTRNCRS